MCLNFEHRASSTLTKCSIARKRYCSTYRCTHTQTQAASGQDCCVVLLLFVVVGDSVIVCGKIFYRYVNVQLH